MALKLYVMTMQELKILDEKQIRTVWDEVLSSHSARKAFAGNMYKNVKDPNLVCALTGHKEGSKAFNRYRMIDEETNRQTMSYLE